MSRMRSVILGLGTLTAALGIGFFMQYGSNPSAGAEAMAVKDITLTSSAGVGDIAAPAVSGMPSASDLPALPQEAVMPDPRPTEPILLAAADTGLRTDSVALPGETAVPTLGCDVAMTAEAVAGAMVELTLTAPCLKTEPVTLHHSGLMLSEITDAQGTLKLTVPALTETAIFIVAFNNGDGAMAKTDVPSLSFYDRVAVQWRGGNGLQLHAREFGADYWSDGHVWQEARGDLADAARGEGGFLTRLGQPGSPEALMAEVYSFPVGTAQRSGDILVSVEAEVTAQNCDRDVEAQTIELRNGGTLRVQDLTLSIPACDAVGDFLVLKNLIDDLTIASN